MRPSPSFTSTKKPKNAKNSPGVDAEGWCLLTPSKRVVFEVVVAQGELLASTLHKHDIFVELAKLLKQPYKNTNKIEG